MLAETLHTDGHDLLPAVLTLREIERTIASLEAAFREHIDDPAVLKDEDGAIAGARDVLRLHPDVVQLLRSDSLRTVLFELLGSDAAVVRVLYFDKPPGKGWALPWHKDRNIAVQEHGPLGRFKKPTTKAGVPHVEAPEELLRRMITVRIHLDDMNDDNGPLRVIPGSHLGDETRPAAILHCRAGDALLMRPLLTHASSHCSADCVRHRRVVHFECAADRDLPDGYHWRDRIQVPRS
jgi:hypothetical protein